jgi:hypothetical protein
MRALPSLSHHGFSRSNYLLALMFAPTRAGLLAFLVFLAIAKLGDVDASIGKTKSS